MGTKYTIDANGNITNGGSHRLPMTNGGVPVSGAVAAPLEYFEQALLTVAITGAISIPSYTIYLARINKTVFMSMPPWSGTATATSGAFIVGSLMPARFRPPAGMFYIAIGTSVSQDSQLVQVIATGQIQFWRTVGGNAFNSGQLIGFKGQGLSWRVA